MQWNVQWTPVPLLVTYAKGRAISHMQHILTYFCNVLQYVFRGGEVMSDSPDVPADVSAEDRPGYRCFGDEDHLLLCVKQETECVSAAAAYVKCGMAYYS